MPSKAPAIGIDLGTTYSCVGVFQDGNVTIIEDDQGDRKIPSCVAFTEYEQLVGHAAQNQVARNPCNTIFDIKRLIGRRFDDQSVQTNMTCWPFTLINDGTPRIQVDFMGKSKMFSVEEVSSMLLLKMKENAEEYLDQVCTIRRDVLI